jgi:hypothetical protein
MPLEVEWNRLIVRITTDSISPYFSGGIASVKFALIHLNQAAVIGRAKFAVKLDPKAIY